MLLPLAQLEQTIRNAPENLLFFSTDDLVTVAENRSGRYSENAGIECVAELVTRWYLKPSAEIETCFDHVFPKQEWHSLKKLKERGILVPPTVESLPEKLWDGESPESFSFRCEVAVRRHLADLFRTDGFIPVYFGSDAYFLPFFLEENEQLPLIGDAAGNPIENWLKIYQTLFGKNPEYRCTVLCRQTNRLPALAGSSLMLPLFLAVQRKTGKLPQYNCLRLLSTGAMEHGRLKAVATEEKKKALTQCFADACLFFPESSRVHLEDAGAIALNISLNHSGLLEEIQRQIEAKGLVVPTLREAINRLSQIDYETRHANQPRWEMMLDRLNTNMEAIEKSSKRVPEAFLLCLMLQSAIFCHKGNTSRAWEFNRRARQWAERFHFEKRIRQLEIEELVVLQDVEDFDSVRELSVVLKEKIECLKDDDLLMRYYGTMGQAHCYGFLAGVPGFEPDQAKSCFAKALQHAQKLNSEQEIAQDLNYRYLWHVLFSPSSNEAARAYDEAYDHIERNLQDDPPSQKKNRYFLQRLKMQALYRRHLAGERIAEEPDYQAEDLPQEALFWLRALVKKYLGALAAANGKRELAERYFREAIQLLEQDSRDEIIAFIRMTVFAEAFRSLRENRYRESGRKLLNQHFRTSNSWRDYFETGNRFPGWNYWY